MALFKISKGTKANLNSQTLTEGYCWFTPEDGKFYIDAFKNGVLTRIPLNAAMADSVAWTNVTGRPGNATSTKGGLLTDAQAVKLAGIATGAEVNQNAFSNIKIGSTTVAADTKTDTVEFDGSNITISGDATNDKITFSLTKTNVTTALGYTPPTTNTTYDVATQSANGLMSSTDKKKLDGIATGAEVNQNAFSNIKIGDSTIAADTKTDTLELAGSNVTLTPNTTNDKITIGITSANVINALGYTPPQQDTTYSNATTSAAGLMSADDKTKLNGIATGAEVNQNAFGKVKVGSTTVEADAKIDTLELVGSNVTITPDATNDKVTIGITKTNVTTALGYTPPTQDTTYSAATQSTSGLMSSDDKTKLDGIATGAEVNQNAFSTVAVLASGSGTATNVAADSKTDTLTLAGSSTVTLTGDATNDKVTFSLTKANVTTALGYTPPTQDTTYSNATTSAAGLMSADDKTKLNGIATGAEVNQNAFSNIKVGSTTVAADAKTDTVEFVGSNVTITPDATNDKVTFSLTSSNVTTALGYTPPQQDTTYSAATQSAAGLMSAADKKKLDGIATGAQVNVLESVTASGTAPLTLTAGSISNKSIAISGSIADASTSAKGVVQVGSGLNVSSGTVSVATTAGTSTLAWGSEVTLGTVGGLAIKAKLPSNPNSDTKVTQTNSTTNADYRIVLSGTADDTTRAEAANKSTNLRFNPSTKILSVGGNITATGDLTITGVSNLNGETYASSVNAGSLLVTGATSFTQIPTAPTPATSSNDTSVATTAFVKNNLGGLSGAMHFKGTTTTEMTDGRTTAAVTISGSSYTPSAGDVVLYSDSEFVWTGSAWERLGRDSSFKVQQTAVTTATAETTTATTFVHSITQDANGVITVKTRPLPTYNNYSLPTASTSTKGGIKVGTGLTMSGEVMNHSNSVTAQTTQALYPIKIDAQGHISAYGTAVTSLPASDVSAWAKASTKPSYALSEITGADDVKAIEALTGTTGILKKTAANTWTLDTTAYTTNTGTVTKVTAGTGLNTSADQADSATKGSITTTGTLYLTTSGVTAGSYGPSANATPAYGATFNVPYVTVDKYGRVTAASTKTVKIPASDNTDTKQNITLATTSKAYITGVTTTPTSTAQALTGVADTGVYLTATAGEISAVRHSFNVSGTEKAYSTYNSTTESIDFIFV